MKHFTVTALLVASLSGFAMAAANVAVDPYGISATVGMPAAGLVRTRADEDGGRLSVGFRLAGAPRTLLIGNSRAQEGFAGLTPPWGGPMLNAGMPAANAFETTRALALAAKSPDLKCVLLLLDFSDFDAMHRVKAGYWMSPLSDGSRALSFARTAVSGVTLQRTAQTIADNASGKGPVSGRDPRGERWKRTYRAGEQRRRFLMTAEAAYSNYRASQYDPQRVAFLTRAVDQLTARGVQVIGIFPPLHALQSEAIYAAGAQDRYLTWRRDVVAALGPLGRRTPSSPCIGGGGLVLRDFGGYQAPSSRAVPAETAIAADPDYYEASHFTPTLGRRVLAGLGPQVGSWGALITPDTLASADQAAAARRQQWRTSPSGREAAAFFDAEARKTLPPDGADRYMISPSDWRWLERMLPPVGRPAAAAG